MVHVVVIGAAQEPSKLLIQVPRFGKKFKAFQKIIPNKILDIKEVTVDAGDSGSVLYNINDIVSLQFDCC